MENTVYTLENRFDFARSIIDEAAKLALDYFNNFTSLKVESKLNGQDVVSIADKNVEILLRDKLIAAFPQDGFLGEEDGLQDGTSGYLWVVDPIDGTSNFLHGISEWCVSVGLMHGQDYVAGLIAVPCRNELFLAQKDKGATLNGKPIQVGFDQSITDGFTGIGANLRVPASLVSDVIYRLLSEGGMFERGGSGAIALTNVACGRFVAYYEPHINLWDVAAGICLIREAGGWVNDFQAGEGLSQGGPIICGAPQVKQDLYRIIEG